MTRVLKRRHGRINRRAACRPGNPDAILPRTPFFGLGEVFLGPTGESGLVSSFVMRRDIDRSALDA